VVVYRSVSILAALVDSLVDIAASLTNLLVVRYSLQPADEEHTFGHGKAESLAALAQSMFISGSALFLFLTGIQHLVSPTPMNDPGVGVVVTVIALISTLVLVTFQRWVVRKTQSQAVRADMLHYQSDVMMNGAILIALGLAWYGWHRADALFALGIGSIFYIAPCGWGMKRCNRCLIAHFPMQNVMKFLPS
jgi:ferrous-iron efflux pump FieF